jgi:hypothetical protein
MVNRRGVWGGYYPLSERGKEYTARDGTRKKLGNSYTAPRFQNERGKVLLTTEVLVRHFRGQRPEHTIGLHSTSPDNTSKWGAADIDKHEGSTASPEVNFKAARFWHGRLVDLGFTPLLADSNGQGGFHLWTLFNASVSTIRVFAFLQWLTSDFAKHGLTARPETFPKQPAILPGRYGNWLRLPGRHHSRPHWARVWSGSHWLEGAEAVEFILQLQGDPPQLIPTDLVLPAVRKAEDVRHVPPLTTYDQAGNLGHRIQGRLARLPNLAAGQCRHGVAYRFGTWLVRDLNLPDEIALAWLARWDSRNSPPLGESELREIVSCARNYGQHAYGCGLSSPPPVRSSSSRRHAHSTIRFTVRF